MPKFLSFFQDTYVKSLEALIDDIFLRSGSVYAIQRCMWTKGNVLGPRGSLSTLPTYVYTFLPWPYLLSDIVLSMNWGFSSLMLSTFIYLEHIYGFSIVMLNQITPSVALNNKSFPGVRSMGTLWLSPLLRLSRGSNEIISPGYDRI